jgi:hypothetical protein
VNVIKTSNYASAGRLPNAVAISQGVPKWFQGALYKKLAPSWTLIRSAGTKEQYELRYFQEVLSKLDPKKVFDELDGSIILCYEPAGEILSGDSYCHRRMVAAWLEKALGIEVPEYQKPSKAKPTKEKPTVANVVTNIIQMSMWG